MNPRFRFRRARFRAAAEPFHLAPHLRRIAELSAQAVAIVDEARSGPAARQSIDDMLARKTGYRNIIGELIDEDKALIPICHPRSAIR